MNKREKVLVTAADKVLHELSRRSYDDTRRFSEGLVCNLLVHELLRVRRDWKSRMWSEVRPFPDEDKERIDIWIDHQAGEPVLALEVKVADPDFKWGNGKYAIRGGVVSDFLKLADLIKHATLTIGGYVLLLGRTDYLSDETALCHLARDPHTKRFIGNPTKLLPGKGERYYAGLDEWFEPRNGVPRRIAVRRLHYSLRGSLGVWLWRVGLS